MSKKLALIFGGAFILLPGIFFLVGLGLSIHQRRIIETYRPVQARVLLRRVETVSGRNNDTYKPLVRYRYRVNGHTYTSQRYNALNDSASYSWAQTCIHRYHVGQRCAAWYNPENPNLAVLDRTASFIPTGLMLFVLPFFAVAIGVLYGAFARTEQNNVPQPSGPNWYVLLPEANLRRRERFWLIVALAVDGALLLILWNYFSIASRPYGLLVEIVTAVCVLIALIPLVFIRRMYRLGGLLQDGRVELGGTSLVVGQAVNCRISQTYRRAVTIKKVTLTLQCRRIQKMGNTTNEDFPWQHEQVVGEAAQAAAGEELTWTTALMPPAGWPGSTAPNSGANPDYRYYLKLAVSFAGAPGYSEKFIVQLASDASASLMPPGTAGFAPAGSSAGMP